MSDIKYKAFGSDDDFYRIFDTEAEAEEWLLGDGAHPDDYRQVEVESCSNCGREFDIEDEREWAGYVVTQELKINCAMEDSQPEDGEEMCVACRDKWIARRRPGRYLRMMRDRYED